MNPGVIAPTLLAITLTAMQPVEPVLLWETDGFLNPESVIYDAAENVLYVSNVNGPPAEKDGNGFLSRVSTDGRVIAPRWVSGLNGPKGLGIRSGKLYVADIDTLVEIDIASASITARYPAASAKFLNDVTVAQDGSVYVSDSAGNRIYRLKDAKLEVWLESENLAGLNGLLAEPGRLLVAAGGDEKAGRPGRLLAVSLQDKSVSTLSSDVTLGFLDGLEADGDGGYYLTNWVAGSLLRVDANGSVELLLQLTRGTADLDFDAGSATFYLPRMLDGKVAAYRAAPPK